jgi:uncharacterized protein (DUF488 family)
VDRIAPPPMILYTVGHSNRSADELIAILAAAEVACVVDVRGIPRSRANPQFAIDVLPRTLAAAGLDYVHVADLGGRRPRQRAIDEDVNAGWTHRAFHNYADYAMTAPFRDALRGVLARAADERCAVMCAEAVWWRCHRRIVADHALAHGFEVVHLLDRKQEPGRLTPFASVGPGTRVTYPPTSSRRARPSRR